MKRLNLIIGLLVIILLLPVFTEATPVDIENAGFEDLLLSDGSRSFTIPGWTISGGLAGTYNPLTSRYTDGIPEGSNVAYANYGAIISQTVSNYIITENTELTLSVDIGWRSDYSLTPQYEIQLWAGGNLLDSVSTSTLIIGDFVTSILSYEVLEDNPYIGQSLTIVLLNTGVSGTQVNFDNVRLENHPVPEPSTLLLLGSGLLGLGYFIRKKRG
ncbi:MAG: PEP-CTERM sorting domain-containing protein [Nitrospirota bacterium]